MPGYSQDAAVRAIRSYYVFLAAKVGALRPSSIIEPPFGGWPTITTGSFAPLGKTETVNELLRHLPYIRSGSSDGWNSNIAYETSALQYGGTTFSERQLKAGFGQLAGTLPVHVVQLTEGGRYGSCLLLDTLEGTVTDYIQQDHPERSEPGPDSPDHWRAYKTLPVEEFFKQWKENFRSLDWIVVPQDEEDGMMLMHDIYTDEVRKIYRDHGWPEAFDREAFHRALVTWYNGPRSFENNALSAYGKFAIEERKKGRQTPKYSIECLSSHRA